MRRIADSTRVQALAEAVPATPASRVALICPTMWDAAELPALVADGRVDLVSHGDDASEYPERFDADGFIAEALERFTREPVDGVMASDDYPGTPVAAAIAQALGLDGPSPHAILLCQHKYYSRIAQREVVPEAVPDFRLVRSDDLERSIAGLQYPVFVKPVKSFFSVLAQRVDGAEELRALAERARAHLEGFVRPFNRLLARHTAFEFDGGHLIAEGLLEGRQVTVEGCVWRGEVQIVGIVDSIMYPGTISFERFEYPSSLAPGVQSRMEAIAARFMRSIGFDHGLFNIEMMYDAAADAIRIIEVNPRMCPQFADLMEKVNGVNTYEIALAIAAGQRPQVRREGARFRAAASLVPRLFADQVVRRVPDAADLARLRERFPDARVKVLCRPGRRLGEELQDGVSFRYAVLNLGGESRAHVLARYAEAMRELPFAFEPHAA